jgi:hypothetical protein
LFDQNLNQNNMETPQLLEHTPMKALTTTIYIRAHTPTHTHIPTFSTPILNYEKKIH